MSLMVWVASSVAALTGYLLGSINFAVVYCKITRQDDVRTLGSGNAGMTNILRNYGKKAAAFTAVGDILKGVLSAALGILWFSLLTTQVNPEVGGYIAGGAAILGHIYPLYFGFKGGKAILVSFGVLIYLLPYVAVTLFVIFAVELFFTHIVSLCSITVALLAPVVTLIWRLALHEFFILPTIFSLCMGFYITWLHRSNIQRIKAGTEAKITFGKSKK